MVLHAAEGSWDAATSEVGMDPLPISYTLAFFGKDSFLISVVSASDSVPRPNTWESLRNLNG